MLSEIIDFIEKRIRYHEYRMEAGFGGYSTIEELKAILYFVKYVKASRE